MRWLGIAWNIAAGWFLVSVIAAPFFLVIRKARARGKRLFVDLPAERLGPPPVHASHVDHRWDAM